MQLAEEMPRKCDTVFCVAKLIQIFSFFLFRYSSLRIETVTRLSALEICGLFKYALRKTDLFCFHLNIFQLINDRCVEMSALVFLVVCSLLVKVVTINCCQSFTWCEIWPFLN